MHSRLRSDGACGECIASSMTWETGLKEALAMLS